MHAHAGHSPILLLEPNIRFTPLISFSEENQCPLLAEVFSPVIPRPMSPTKWHERSGCSQLLARSTPHCSHEWVGLITASTPPSKRPVLRWRVVPNSWLIDSRELFTANRAVVGSSGENKRQTRLASRYAEGWKLQTAFSQVDRKPLIVTQLHAEPRGPGPEPDGTTTPQVTHTSFWGRRGGREGQLGTLFEKGGDTRLIGGKWGWWLPFVCAHRSSEHGSMYR